MEPAPAKPAHQSSGGGGHASGTEQKLCHASHAHAASSKWRDAPVLERQQRVASALADRPSSPPPLPASSLLPPAPPEAEAAASLTGDKLRSILSFLDNVEQQQVGSCAIDPARSFV